MHSHVKKTLFWMLMLGMSVCCSALLYWHWGAWPALQHYRQAQRDSGLVANMLAQHRRDPQQLVKRFEALTETNPQDTKAWYYLGKLYMGQGEYDHALQAYSQALHQQSDNADYQTAYAEASFFSNGNRLDAAARQLLLHQSLDNVIAQNLLAVDAFNRQRYGEAVRRWEQLVTKFPPDSENAQQLYVMIAKAQRAERERSASP